MKSLGLDKRALSTNDTGDLRYGMALGKRSDGDFNDLFDLASMVNVGPSLETPNLSRFW